MSDRAWKRRERRIADLLGGRRVPVTGRNRGDAPDVEHEDLAIEVKDRKRLPAWIHDALAQATACARPGQLPIAVLHQRGQQYDQSMVVIQIGQFVRWLEERQVI